jgi:hypothetical protein
LKERGGDTLHSKHAVQIVHPYSTQPSPTLLDATYNNKRTRYCRGSFPRHHYIPHSYKSMVHVQACALRTCNSSSLYYPYVPPCNACGSRDYLYDNLPHLTPKYIVRLFVRVFCRIVEFGNFGSTSQYNCLETTFSPLPSSSSSLAMLG